MTILTQVEPVEIRYPNSDGEPMAETDIARDCMAYGIEAANLYFQGRSDVYVSANSFIYYHIKKATTGSISFWQKAFFFRFFLTYYAKSIAKSVK